MIRPPPRSTLFPDPTLFRSMGAIGERARVVAGGKRAAINRVGKRGVGILAAHRHMRILGDAVARAAAGVAGERNRRSRLDGVEGETQSIAERQDRKSVV